MAHVWYITRLQLILKSEFCSQYCHGLFLCRKKNRKTQQNTLSALNFKKFKQNASRILIRKAAGNYSFPIYTVCGLSLYSISSVESVIHFLHFVITSFMPSNLVKIRCFQVLLILYDFQRSAISQREKIVRRPQNNVKDFCQILWSSQKI